MTCNHSADTLTNSDSVEEMRRFFFALAQTCEKLYKLVVNQSGRSFYSPSVKKIAADAPKIWLTICLGYPAVYSFRNDFAAVTNASN